MSSYGAATATGGESGAPSGSGGRASRPKENDLSGALSGQPTAARLAHQQRSQKPGNSRQSVRDFVQQQSQTENLLDPNAPTPSPATPSAGEEDNEPSQSIDELGDGQGLGIQGVSKGHEWGEGSEADNSVRDSSELTTGSSVEPSATKTGEEPIVTFRFEHISTEDGHHVVVGREGKLSKCEEEPITTPGAVQGFGVLLVLEEDFDTGVLAVRQVSEVSRSLVARLMSRTRRSCLVFRLNTSFNLIASLDCLRMTKRISCETTLNISPTPVPGKAVSKRRGHPFSCSLATARLVPRKTMTPAPLGPKLDNRDAIGRAGSPHIGRSSLRGIKWTRTTNPSTSRI